MAATVEKVSLFKRISNYFREVKSELKKVIWPSPAQTAKSTSATIAFVLLIAII